MMVGNTFSEITENNHAGVIWVISLLCMIYSVLTLFARGVIKWHMVGPDDVALVAAQVLAFGQYGALFGSLHYGLGRTSEMLNVKSRVLVSNTAFTSEILLLLSLALSKCSIIFLVRRVFTRDMKHFWLICNIALAFVCTWGITSVVLVSVGCNVSKYVPPNGNETCEGFATRWNIVIALDVISELVMFILPICFLWTLQMTLDLKARVVIAFAFRLPVIAFSILFVRIFTTVQHAPNPGVSISTAIAWQQVTVSYSLISATIPCLKSFIKSFDTNFGMGEGSSSGPYTYSSSNSQSHLATHSHSHYQPKPKRNVSAPDTIQMHSLKPRRSAKFRKEPESTKVGEDTKHHVGKLRPEKLKHLTTIRAGRSGGGERPGSNGSTSSMAGSQELIIRRDVQFDVRSDYTHGSEQG
ncbi:uncharacterized protein BDR25DRAFT_256791 [Lindgomyces ingoldianus]|uniref:Uncharacterized protein n=1 Tax=Lindgomyces ingoldianus TaxID=673940 RepID=A0ACB6R5P3_9PLEO|nr:uncharacterized protein BDR25DRAFT_256791 [Lindgomyces ingoldianus]KAF2473847.1 hypothetical protein BDR25DRAFT_256791 [Lindgomyces ingoldianus]